MSVEHSVLPVRLYSGLKNKFFRQKKTENIYRLNSVVGAQTASSRQGAVDKKMKCSIYIDEMLAGTLAPRDKQLAR